MKANNSQADKFKQAAKELECEESEASFEERLRRVAKQKPKGEDDKEEPGQ